jgi:hypothetical protein
MAVNVFAVLNSCAVTACRYIPRYNLNWLLEPTWSFISKPQYCHSYFALDKRKVVSKNLMVFITVC